MEGARRELYGPAISAVGAVPAVTRADMASARRAVTPNSPLNRTPDNPPRGLIPVAKNQADLSGRIRLPAGPSGSVLAQASGASGWICPRERIRPLGGCEPPKSAKLDLSAARLPLVRSFRSFHDLLLAYILSHSTIWLKKVGDPSPGAQLTNHICPTWPWLFNYW